MFVIEPKYTAELSEIDRAMKAHVAFLKKYYQARVFVASGRKIPREGGVILATGPNRQEIESIMNEDPFCSRGLAEFRVTEFRLSQRSPELERLFREEPAR